MQFRSFRHTHCTGIVIRYIASECVRLRSTPPAAVCLPILRTDTGRGMHVLFNKKIVGGIPYLVCAMVCIDYRHIKC